MVQMSSYTGEVWIGEDRHGWFAWRKDAIAQAKHLIALGYKGVVVKDESGSLMWTETWEATPRTVLLEAHVPSRAIPCTLLHRAMGKRYGAAERTLHRNGWVYLIAYDAWVYGWGERPPIYTPNLRKPFDWMFA